MAVVSGGLRRWRGNGVALVLCLALLILSAVLPCAGCGKAEKGAPAEEEQAVEEAAEEGGAGETVEEETAEGGEEVVVSESGGYTEFDLEDKHLRRGGFNRGLRVSDIRWADHGEYFRIVFEFRRADGGEVTVVPNVSTRYPGPPDNKEYWNLYITLEDIVCGEFSSPLFSPDVPVSLGDPLVEKMRWEYTADTDQVRFLVECSYSPAHPGVSSRPHRLMYMTHPMRIVVDIRKF